MKKIHKVAWMTFRDGKVLLVRSADKDVFYTLGGKREEGEDDVDALIREIGEEVGVDLLPESLDHLHTFTEQAHGQPDGVMVEIKAYSGEGVGEFAPSSEIAEIGWFDTSDMERVSPTAQIVLAWLAEEGYVN